MKEFGWYKGLARAVVDAKGCCVYCEEDLLVTRLGYSSIVMDHLLPRSVFSQPEIEANHDNHVLACSSCNGMKENFNPLQPGEDPLWMLSEKQSLLIERVREALGDKIEARKTEWSAIQKKITS